MISRQARWLRYIYFTTTTTITTTYNNNNNFINLLNKAFQLNITMSNI